MGSPTHSKELCIVAVHGGARDRRQHLRHVPELQKMGADNDNDNGSHCGGPAVLLFDKQEHGLSDGNHRGIGKFVLRFLQHNHNYNLIHECSMIL